MFKGGGGEGNSHEGNVGRVHGLDGDFLLGAFEIRVRHEILDRIDHLLERVSFDKTGFKHGERKQGQTKTTRASKAWGCGNQFCVVVVCFFAFGRRPKAGKYGAKTPARLERFKILSLTLRQCGVLRIICCC